MKKAACRFGICSLCASHCKCRPQEPEVLQTPKPKRSTHEEILCRIKEAVADRTPAALKTNDVDNRSWKDFYELVPRSEAIIARLHDTIQVTATTGRTTWSALISYAGDLVKKLGEVVARSDQVSKVQGMLLEGMAKKYNTQAYREEERVRNAAEHSTKEILKELLAYVRQNKTRNEEGSRLIRSIVTRHLREDQLDFVQKQAGIPEGERVVYGAYARAQGRKDYAKMFLCGCDNIGLKDLVRSTISTSISRVSDDVVMNVVAFIVHNCDIKSWGEKTLPIGGGATVAIPSLTRKCGIEEMWELYSQSKEDEKVPFQRILRHDGPFTSGHKYYKSSAYNLLILWADGSKSWEPLYDFQLDDPVTCALYAKANDLLDVKGWARLKSKVNEVGTAQVQASLKAFKNGRNVIGRSSFLEMAQVLTNSGEKLVSSVDYVRGVLIHDVVDVLQRIIDDCVTSKQKIADLTRMLKNASNFLKNQYKTHVLREDDCDSHGIDHGLLAPVVLKTRKHYSCMEKAQLEHLLVEREIPVKKNSTIVARIHDLEAWDKAQEQRQQHCALISWSVSDLTSCCTSESDFLLDELTERLNLMALSELRVEIKSEGLQVKARTAQPLRDALLEHYRRSNTQQQTEEEASIEREEPPGVTHNKEEDDGTSIESHFEPDETKRDGVEVDNYELEETETAATCLGCAFIHKFMLEVLPQAIKNEQSEKNKDKIENAFVYIEDAHEKFMLYMGHQVRVVNQNKKLNDYDEELETRCFRERNLEAICLYLIIDFKMKWEPMYQREKTTQNFGKRGISWHGIRAQYYVWDDEKQEPAKVVVKLDQILDGSNKQDGLNVIALIEAALVYLHQEFPFASIEYVQSDNAAAYHLKELILAIPLLNAVRIVLTLPKIQPQNLQPFSSTKENEETWRPSDPELRSHRNAGWEEPTRCAFCSRNSFDQALLASSQRQ